MNKPDGLGRDRFLAWAIRHREFNKTRDLIFESAASLRFQKLKFGFNEVGDPKW